MVSEPLGSVPDYGWKNLQIFFGRRLRGAASVARGQFAAACGTPRDAAVQARMGLVRPSFEIGPVHVGVGGLFLIAGPCVIESEAHARRMAEAIQRIASDLKV